MKNPLAIAPLNEWVIHVTVNLQFNLSGEGNANEKTKLLKSVCSLLLAGSMACGLTGCASDAGQTAGQASEKQGDSKESAGTGGETVQTTEAAGSTSFTYWLPIHAQTAQVVTDLNDHPGAKRLEEQTGILVDYMSPPVGQEKEQMNLLLASGKNLPDLIKFDFAKDYRGGVEAAIADGVLMDATKLIEEHAPNFMARINAKEELKKGAYSDAGVIVKFGATLLPDETPVYVKQGPMINKTLLDQAGLDIPVTIADWEEMLAAFKEMDVIPFSFGCDNNFAGLFGAFSGAYGVPAGSRFLNENGVVKFGPMQDGYQDFLQLFHKWYQNGWLDPDFLSKQQNKDIKPEFEAGELASGTIHIDSIESAPVTSAKMNHEKVDAMPVPYPVLNEGDQLHFRHRLKQFNQTPSYISAQAEDPVAIIKWMDYLYSDKGQTETFWGCKGDDRYEDTYYIDENGELQFTDFITKNPDGLAPSQALRRYIFKDVVVAWSEGSSEAVVDGCRIWEASADCEYEMPETLTLSLEENDEYSKLMGDIETYVNEKSAKFIMGIEPLDQFDNFRQTLLKMNIERVTEIRQAALDRYLVR